MSRAGCPRIQGQGMHDTAMGGANSWGSLFPRLFLKIDLVLALRLM